ncbi:MAG TPA: site-2 protease family protein [Methanomassiliicoccales archaeon]|nr:site-2 protease family protein [Methanomassiliicoccales archaeon]
MLLFAYVFGFTSGSIFGFELGYGQLPLDWPWLLLLGAIAAVLFFASVLVHELAHSYYAIRRGYVISGITLFIFGGVSQIEKAPENAPGEGVMAFVGPLTSLVIGAVTLPIYLLIQDASGNVALQAAAITVSIVSFYNLFLGAFNLIPAFPMDGGRVLRAYLAKRMSFLRATELAANIGRVAAVVLAVVGILFSIFLAFVAIFIYIAAGEELRETRIHEALKGIKARDIMTRNYSTVTSQDTVATVLAKMIGEKRTAFPVVDGQDLVGLVTTDEVGRVAEKDRPITLVARIMSSPVQGVSPETEATDVVERMSASKSFNVPVMEDGNLVGFITQADIARTVQIAIETGRGRGSRPSPGANKP